MSSEHVEPVASTLGEMSTVTPGPDAIVYLVRHGRTELNASDRLRGRIDVELDAIGHAQAAALGERFRDVPVALVASSPLTRCRTTASTIATATGSSCRIEHQLIDRDYGQWAGSPGVEVEDQFGSLDSAPGVEHIETLTKRAVACLERLITDTNAPLIVVAHDAVNRAILAGLVPSLGSYHDVPQRVGCWNQLERRAGRWTAPVVDAVTDLDRQH